MITEKPHRRFYHAADQLILEELPRWYTCLMKDGLRRIAPTVITIGGLLFGMRAILYAFQGQVVASAYYIVIATLIDIVDGAAARLLHAGSVFGQHMDTLSDAVTVGVAPAVLLYAVYFKGWGTWGAVTASGWTISVLARLAYFESNEDRDPLYFLGLPSPPAANVLSGFVLFSSRIWHHYPYRWLVLAAMITLSFLMLSKLRVEKGAFFTPKRIVRSWPGRTVFIGVILAIVYPWAAPFVIASTLVILVICRDLFARAAKHALNRKVNSEENGSLAPSPE
jgi:CDP-diacylglycerol--serine O-phosphatidyltransferase